MDQEILDELKKLNQNLNNRGAFSSNTPSSGGGTGSSTFGKALDGATGLLKDFGKQINQGGGRLSTTTESISKAFATAKHFSFLSPDKRIVLLPTVFMYFKRRCASLFSSSSIQI